MKIVGHKSEKLWKRYNVIDERDLTQAAQKVTNTSKRTSREHLPKPWRTTQLHK